MCLHSHMRDPLAFRFGIAAAGVAAAMICGVALAQDAVPVPPTIASQPLTVPATTLFPADRKLPPEDPNAKKYDNNPKAVADGANLFNWMNCSGCHFHGAGGMGPPFINGGHFIYGGRLDQIFASIYQGRPNGMPSWGQKLAPEQIWALAAYVKSLSGSPTPQPVLPQDHSTPQDAVPATAGTANP